MTRKEIVFVGLSLVLAWLVALPLWLSQSRPTWLIQVTALGMMPMPTLAAIITHRIYHSDKPFIDITALRGGKPLTVLRWCCVASFSVVIQLIATIMVGALSGAGNFSFSDAAIRARLPHVPGVSSALDPSTLPPAWLLLVIALVSGIVGGFSFNAIAALGEEVGWRGWWASQRQGQNFWVNAVVIGAIWGLWHLPINMVGYNYPGANRVAACSMFVVYCICAGSLLLELRNRSHSIYPAAVAHSTINGLVGICALFMDSSPTMWLVYSPTGVVGCVVLVVITLVLRRIPARPPQASSMNVDRPQAGMRERH
ncbi:CPBP family intramembrane glutamic endopeptidase [Corynebacterium durum]|uniref:CPBP family intramembrane glutamic endopeptidase n=1 Tax=Corynebacterium durum TaxID=61592 RepID=UPI0026DAFB72|nr:CPBP family intramembrane glutamic endopeptidase [Corynebacterium durum]MDO4653625.1 CPBP family intramembrane metalloprotease [Corynebacterium durum]